MMNGIAWYFISLSDIVVYDDCIGDAFFPPRFFVNTFLSCRLQESRRLMSACVDVNSLAIQKNKDLPSYKRQDETVLTIISYLLIGQANLPMRIYTHSLAQ